jgi:alpha/beta superfamily hydrolase
MVKIPLVGDLSLEGMLDRPSTTGPLGDAVVVCHPHPAFGGRMHTPLIEALAQAFVSAGLTTLRFHFRGIEGSEGKATGGLVEHEDVAAAARFLGAFGAERIALVGYSFGALMSLKAIAAGLRPVAYVGIAIPTGVVGGEPARVGEVDAALAAGQPSRFIAGDADPVCEVECLRAWVNDKDRASLEVIAGEGHGFSLAGTRAVVRSSLAQLRGAFA